MIFYLNAGRFRLSWNQDGEDEGKEPVVVDCESEVEIDDFDPTDFSVGFNA